MPRNFNMKAESGHYKLTGQDVCLIHEVRERVIKKNWPLISLYGLVTVAGVVASYFTSEWVSVGVSAIVALFTFAVGLRMLQEIVTITKEIR